MPKNVESTNWESLGYPQVPELLQQLTSDDPHIQVRAANRLESEIILGGKDWESFDLGAGISVALRSNAPSLLVPFFLNLLGSDSTVNKDDILYLLSRMLFYTQMIDEGEIYKQRAAKIRTAIWEGRLIYVDLLSSESIGIRIAALSILMEFNESPRILEAYDLIVRRFEPSLPPPESTPENG